MAAELEKLYQEVRASKDRHRMRATAEVFLAMDMAMTDNLVGAMENLSHNAPQVTGVLWPEEKGNG
jgi:hypothetical protein